MRFFDWLRPSTASSAAVTSLPAASPASRPRMQGESIALYDLTDPAVEGFLRRGGEAASGAIVNEQTAMKVAVAWRCTSIISGMVGWMPVDIMRRVDERTRVPAVGHPLRRILTRKPNIWQTPSEFRRMMQVHLLLRGNAYAFIVWSRGQIVALIPLHPDRVLPVQNEDLTMTYTYTRRDGVQVTVSQKEMLHLRGLTLDGITGMSVISYAREALGLSIQTEMAGSRLFKTGNLTGLTLNHPQHLSDEAYDRLRESLDEKSGAENAAQTMILEEGMKLEPVGMSAEDMQFLATRDFQRTDVGMFFGVPPHRYGDTSKATSFGTGIEQQNIGFLQDTMMNWFTTWEDSIDCFLLGDTDDTLNAKFNVNGLMRGDFTSRMAGYQIGINCGIWSPNDVRAKEDEAPRPGGDTYVTPTGNLPKTGANNEPAPPAGN